MGPRRDATTNPFSPGADRVPSLWAGRTEQIADFRDRLRPRRAAGLGETGRVLLGEPGIGKSVLVRRLAAELVADGGWDTGQVRVPIGSDPLALLGRALLRLLRDQHATAVLADGAADLLGRLEQVSVLGVGVTVRAADQPPAHVTLTDTLVALGRAARTADTAVLVHVDELQNATDEQQLSQLLVALGDALGHDDRVQVPAGTVVDAALPLLVYVTALPEFHDLASTRTGTTFSRRFATTLLRPLSDEEITAGLRPLVVEGHRVPTHDGDATAPVVLAPPAADRIVRLVHGDPYLFQLAGQAAWDAGSGSTIEVDEVDDGWQHVAATARRHVERQLERLPDLERRVLHAMARLPPEQRTLTSIARATDGYDSASQLGPTAQRLDTVRGLIARHGARRPYTFRARAAEALLTTGWPEEPA